jgi:hypothetical protein
MVVMFGDCYVGGGQYFPYNSYHRNPTGWEFFVPAGTLIAGKLLTSLRRRDSNTSQVNILLPNTSPVLNTLSNTSTK